MNPNVKNIVTNIIALLLVILEPINSYLTTQEFNWGTFVVCVIGALANYFYGKTPKENNG